MRQILKLLVCMMAVVLIVGCGKKKPRYVIGVSQCSQDIWRDKLNDELRMGTYLNEGVDLRFASAGDNDKRQIEQIDSLVALGIDLLIVAPNQATTVSPAIDRAYDSGVPVIVFDRKTNSNKYTSYIGADNEEMGRQMGQYIAMRMKGRGRVLEIMGLKGSTPAIERHKGFSDALSRYPDIELVASLQGDWTEKSAFDAVKAYQGDMGKIDFVFGQNDRMAVGALKALGRTGVKYCGIDGLAGKGNGIECVLDSMLEASYIYPTHGDQVLQLAIDILEGNDYKRDNPLMAAMVTHDNARVLLMQNEEKERQSAYLTRLHDKSDAYLQQLDTQRTITFLAVGIIALLILTVVIIYLYFKQKARINEEREQMAQAQLKFYTQVSHELRTPLTLIEGPLTQLAATQEMRDASKDTSEMLAIVRRNTGQLTMLVNRILTPPDLLGNGDVDLPATEMNLLKEHIEAIGMPDMAGEGSVLIVDDNADIRTYLRTILEKYYQVYEASDGQMGMETAREVVPDIIISDVMMPVMNGLEFCQKVKGEVATSHIPVILLTARSLSCHQIEGYESGADAYITKPFQPDVLLARIGNLLRQRQQLRNLWTPTADVRTLDGAVGDTGSPVADERPVENAFIQRFRHVVEEKMSNSDLSVEDIGTELGLSRVQLYRKVKALTGFSPVELLRKTRLSKARQLLETTDQTISEIAYKVGFTAPSYFTKCFKEEHGVLPGDVREK